MTSMSFHQRHAQAVPAGISVLCPFQISRAKNAELWDTNGRRYIDFSGGIGVLNTGHLHPKIQQAVEQQLKLFSHTCFQVVPYESYIALAEQLNSKTPGKFPKKTAFFTTGAEAVENAVKIARAATKRSGIIAFGGGFHGRTLMGMALTGKVSPYKTNFGPFPAEVFHASFPNLLHRVSIEDALKSLEKIFKYDIDPSRVAAMIFEPVQGEGGFYIAPPDWVSELRKIADTHGIVLIADEVQAGFGRTGKLFAMEHYPVEADLYCLAKSLAGGFPLSAVTGKSHLMDAPQVGGIGGTYAGNPLAIAAALAVLEVMEEEQLPQKGHDLGVHLCAQLQKWQKDLPFIADIRALGAMVAIEINDPETGEPSASLCKQVQNLALENGLILLSCGIYGNVLRFLFPLSIEDVIFEEAIAILKQALYQTCQ